MRPSSCFFFCVVTLFLTSPSVAQSTLSHNWGGGPAPYKISMDPTVKLSGKYSGSLRKTVISDKKADFGTFIQIVGAEHFAERRLKFSAYLKSEGVTNRAGLWMRIDSKELGTVAFDDMKDRAVRGTTDWYKHEIVLDVPKESSSISFGALLVGEGQIWIDDVSFDIVDDSVEVSVEPMRPTHDAITIQNGLPKRPTNLSFESAFVKLLRPVPGD